MHIASHCTTLKNPTVNSSVVTLKPLHWWHRRDLKNTATLSIPLTPATMSDTEESELGQHPLRCCPHWPCWTTSILSGVFLPPYLCGSIHPLARSTTPQRHHSGHCCQGLPLGMDRSFWHSLYHCYWSWMPIRIYPLVSAHVTSRNETISHNCTHPQSNGMVERFHRQLKAALKAQPKPDAWMDSLPLILLGIRTSLKPDINSTAAEMVYGTNIRLPGEFFTPSDSNSLPAHSDFITRLKTTHVFVHDAIRRPFQPPYDGPYPITKRTPKHFTVNINGRHNTISIDCLKPAHIDTSTNTTEHSTEHPPLTPPPHPPTLRPPHAPPAPVAVSGSLPTHLIPCETLGRSDVVNIKFYFVACANDVLSYF